MPASQAGCPGSNPGWRIWLKRKLSDEMAKQKELKIGEKFGGNPFLRTCLVNK